MTLTAEAATWDSEQLHEELAIRMPSRWSFELDPDESINRWVVRVLNEVGVEVWRSEEITPQLVLLNAIGWIEARKSPVSETSPWFRRQGELNSQRVHEQLFSKLSVKEDPPDIDPTEVDSVYSTRRNKD